MKHKQDKIYREIQEAINSLPEHFSILEEQIDLELQMQYFNFSKELKNEFSKEYILSRKDDLYNETISTEEKKNLLVLLASVDEVDAYRAIESYIKSPDPELKDWAILALQESRMILQSSLLDEQQVFISTGLGGHGQKLRYFFVLRGKDHINSLSETQQKLIRSELEFGLKKYDGVMEEIQFEEGFASGLFLMPLKKDIQELFRSVIDECNQYGDFLSEDVILTNVRKLSINEIKDFLNQQEEDEQYDEDDEEKFD